MYLEVCVANSFVDNFGSMKLVCISLSNLREEGISILMFLLGLGLSLCMALRLWLLFLGGNLVKVKDEGWVRLEAGMVIYELSVRLWF